MLGRRFEDGGGRTLGRTRAHAGAPAAASTGGQAKRIEQNGLARPRLAGQHIEAGGEFQARLLDQYDVAYG